MTPPVVLWFKSIPVDQRDAPLHCARHHAFEVRPDGRIDPESCCGRLLLADGDDGIADEPARSISEFDDAPACETCLAVAELELPGPSVNLLS